MDASNRIIPVSFVSGSKLYRNSIEQLSNSLQTRYLIGDRRIRKSCFAEAWYRAIEGAGNTKRYNWWDTSRSEWVNCTLTKSLSREPLTLFPSVEIGCFNYLLVFVAGLVQFSHYAELAVISYIIPMSRCDIALNASERGLLGGACFMGTICSSHLWGFLADTRGRRRIVIPTLFVSFVLDVCASFASDFYTLATFRFLTGFL